MKQNFQSALWVDNLLQIYIISKLKCGVNKMYQGGKLPRFRKWGGVQSYNQAQKSTLFKINFIFKNINTVARM